MIDRESASALNPSRVPLGLLLSYLIESFPPSQVWVLEFALA